MTQPVDRNPSMIVYVGLRKIFRIMNATAHPSFDPLELFREAVEDCKVLDQGTDLSFRGDVIEVRPDSDPEKLAAAFERRAAERAKPASAPSLSACAPETAGHPNTSDRRKRP